MTHKLEQLVVIHELVELGAIDQIDNLLTDNLGDKKLSDEVHIAQNLGFLLLVELELLVIGHLIVILGLSAHGDHNIEIALKSVLNLLQKPQLKEVLLIFQKALLSLQEIAQLRVNIGEFGLTPGLLDDLLDHLIHGVPNLKIVNSL